MGLFMVIWCQIGSHFGYKGDHYGSVRVSGVHRGSIGLIREQCGLIGFIGD